MSEDSIIIKYVVKCEEYCKECSTCSHPNMNAKYYELTELNCKENKLTCVMYSVDSLIHAFPIIHLL